MIKISSDRFTICNKIMETMGNKNNDRKMDIMHRRVGKGSNDQYLYDFHKL